LKYGGSRRGKKGTYCALKGRRGGEETSCRLGRSTSLEQEDDLNGRKMKYLPGRVFCWEENPAMMSQGFRTRSGRGQEEVSEKKKKKGGKASLSRPLSTIQPNLTKTFGRRPCPQEKRTIKKAKRSRVQRLVEGGIFQGEGVWDRARPGTIQRNAGGGGRVKAELSVGLRKKIVGKGWERDLRSQKKRL